MWRFPRAVVATASRALIIVTLATAGAAEIASALPPPFVYLSEIDDSIQQDIRYASKNNFIGRPVEGYQAAQCILTRETALALHRVQVALRKKNKNYSLKVYDCYRPASAVKNFIRWSNTESDQKMKQQYYPDIDKRDLFSRGFIAMRSMHSRGNTVDLTIVSEDLAIPEFNESDRLERCDAPANRRAPDNSLDFGTAFDCFHPKSHTASTDIPESAREQRRLLVEVMSAEGFENYRKEWWHFEKKGAATAEAFDFPVRNPQVQSEGPNEPPAPVRAVPPAPAQARSGCPLTPDASGFFSVDCNGKSIEITVLKDLSSRSEIGTIRNYDASNVWRCDCQVEVRELANSQEWCNIEYKWTADQDFVGWVLFSALQHPKQGSPPSCRRPPK